MGNISQATKKLELKMENLKNQAKVEKDRSILMDKTEEIKKLKKENKAKRATMKKKGIRI